MANKFVQKQFSVVEGNASSQTLRCRWLDDEVTLVLPRRGGPRVICDEFKRGYCEQEDRLCYILASAHEEPDLEAANERAREAEEERAEIARLGLLLDGGGDDDDDDDFDDDFDDNDDDDDWG